ncbi:tRNA-dihydrouridine synthase 3 [Monascus purpureus]|uniref:tRNA-dihydrouridine(47) synthase [NAD(P)(+)] n=1 Tax=Monascus purpureus TaxID=5098 RepID=A0A507QL95_MONPU|nr:tRNA-dihydrouridine synthase 3 [Monascus purpureus]BDD57311.1 tRNA-dihydrouridine synthase 3 [Monascus purpureus]
MDPATVQAQPAEVDNSITNAEMTAPAESAVTGVPSTDAVEERPLKRAKLDVPAASNGRTDTEIYPKSKGIAPVKPEYLVQVSTSQAPAAETSPDDAAEAARHEEQAGEKKGRKKASGLNTARDFGRSEDVKGLCSSRAYAPEFSPGQCSHGDKCRYEHDLRTYLKEYKREDLTTFNGLCPVWDAKGKCYSGWRCRFVGSHMTERETADGKKELVLIEDEERKKKVVPLVPYATQEGIVNVVSMDDKLAIKKRKIGTPRTDSYLPWLDKTTKQLEKNLHGRHADASEDSESREKPSKDEIADNRAQYTEPPFLPSEKRRIYFGPETPVLAPLTTQGNLPFRRLCIELGAQFTYSEMAVSLPLVQGSKSEWALVKGHESEMLPPTVDSQRSIVKNYDNSKDIRFGAQIAAGKPWQAVKATELLSKFSPHLRVIDLNCGCPIDLVYREGSGSALLDNPSKLEKILRGMNTVSQEIPITVKIRMGTKDNSPSALKLCERLCLGGYESSLLGMGAPGVAAITLHGRSRQQRYTRQADWGYISECSALIKRLNERSDEVTDTIRESDARNQPNGGKIYFLGNGDCYSHVDYNDHIQNAGVDSVMVGRGALIKPWIFEEIQAGQYLDKSASERLSLIEKFAKYGLEVWGSDEHGVGTTRRFLLEWLSFTYRYVPIGILEYLPPNIQDRPPAWRGRSDLETLLGSNNYKDWIKITEMFLGPAHKDFKFEPKHKSNAYEAEG